MTTAVWKFRVEMGETRLWVPRGAEPLTVQEQAGALHVWMRVDPLAPEDEMVLHVFGTGHQIPDDLVYVGTWQWPPFVWHLFREPSTEGDA